MKIDKDPSIAIVKMIKAVSIKTRLISIHFIRTILNKGEERRQVLTFKMAKFLLYK